MEIFKRFTIEAAHWLPCVPTDHKCRRLHGHSFQIEIRIVGKPDEKSGWVMDFAAIGEHFAPLHATLDHHCLNDIPGLENPTSENLALWIWTRLKESLPGLTSIEIKETCTAGCLYKGEEHEEHTDKKLTNPENTP